MSNERRSRKFINSWAQVSMAAEIVLHALLLVALIALILFAWPFAGMLSPYSLEDHQAIAKELFLLNYSKWPLFVALAVFVGFVSILFTHHIVGPGYKFERALGELMERNLDVSITLRKWDYFREIQDGLNRVVTRWREDLGKVSRDQKKALSLIRDLRGKTLTAEKGEEIEQLLLSIGVITDSYKGFSV
ncbi:MAG TPA: hypothetical protein VI895_03795 [Bdellovibrionota bacterium]|nr:hypothetical protein [Bdellovibrionota bacterium]